jgi:hypothetical protein
MDITKLAILALLPATFGPFIEGIYEPAENCRLSAPCSFGVLYVPDGAPEPHNGTGRPLTTAFAMPRTTITATAIILTPPT